MQPVYAVDYLTTSEAQKILFPAADAFEAKKIELNSYQLLQIKNESGVRQRNSKPSIWQATQKNKPLGWFMIDEVIGKHEFITYATAISSDGKVLGVEILSYREAKGGEIRVPEWRAKFKGKQLNDPFKLDVDIPNISGATLSCRNVLDGVKRQLVLHKLLSPNQTTTSSGHGHG